MTWGGQRLVALLSLGVLAPGRLPAQCPDGSAPPCARAAPPADARPRLTVHPLENRSADTLDAYLAATLTEDVTAALAETRAIRLVRARGAGGPGAYDLRGSVRRSGGTLRLIAQLERGGEIVWSTRLDETTARAAALPDTLAAGVLAALGIATRPPRAAPRRAVDAAAYDLYLRGRYQLARRTEGSVTRAIALFGDAIARDSTFALGWAWLARAIQFAGIWGYPVPGVSRDGMLARELAASDRAVELDSLSPEVLLMRARVVRDVDPTSRTSALLAVRRALALDSLNADAWTQLGLALSEIGDSAGAVSALERAVAVDPGHLEGLAFHGQMALWGRDYATAVARADSALAVEPAYLFAHNLAAWAALGRGDRGRAEASFGAARRVATGRERIQPLAGLAIVAAADGDTTRARALLAEAEALEDATAPTVHGAVYLATGRLALGDVPAAMGWLERYRPRADLHFQLHLRREPALDALRGRAEFRRVLEDARP